MNRIIKGDQVIVISGKDKGKKGKVLLVLPAQNQLVIENINMVKRHTKPSQQNQQGGIVQKPAALHASKVMPLDPASGKATRIKIKAEKNGSKVRLATKSGKELAVVKKGK